VPDVPGAWRLTLQQPQQGYRFSLDAFLLADFVPAATPGPLLDLGTGCGVVALLLARCRPRGRIVGMELQTTLVRTAQQNAEHNGLRHRVDMLQADIRQACCLFPAGAFGTVVCNPPYRRVGQGRLNANPEKAIARHELALTLPQVLDAAHHLLCRHGAFVLVYHPSRLVELCIELAGRQLRPRRLRQVHPKPQAQASMVLVEAVQGGRQALTVLPPLYVCGPDGRYTAEMEAIFRGRARQGQQGEGGAPHG
jgi:tRNA1Val (adenine37-N6)-methyltransferase